MNLILATVLFLFSFLPAQSASARLKHCVQKIESDCYYHVEKRYIGLKEFEVFWTGDVKGSKSLSISGKAYINKVFIDLTGVVEDNHVSFITSISQGFTYKFVGRFIPGGKPVKDGRIHIQGTLIKLKGKRKIISKRVQLFFSNGGNT